MDTDKLRNIIREEIQDIQESNFIQRKIRKSAFTKKVKELGIKVGDTVWVDLGKGFIFSDNITNIIDGVIFVSKFPKTMISPEQIKIDNE